MRNIFWIIVIILKQVPVGPATQNDWPRLSPSTAGKGDPDDNIPVGCAQYFIAGSFVRSELSVRGSIINSLPFIYIYICMFIGFEIV